LIIKKKKKIIGLYQANEKIHLITMINQGTMLIKRIEKINLEELELMQIIMKKIMIIQKETYKKKINY
jgi:hypothetical protein